MNRPPGAYNKENQEDLMQRHMWKISVAVLAAAALLTAGCGKKKQDPDEVLPEIKTGVNLVVNPGFEEWNGYKPEGWTVKAFSGEGNKMSFYGKSEKTRNGEYSFFLRGLYDTQRWMVATQRFPVRPGHGIVFSADIMSEGVKQNSGQDDHAGVFINFYDKNGDRVSDRNWADFWTRKRTGTTGWRRSEQKAEAPDDARFVEIGLINQMTGYIYFDEVSLVIKAKLDWQSKDEKFITYNWMEERPFPSEDMKRVSDLIEGVARDIGIKEIEGRINYYLYPDEETFMKILDRPKYKTAARWDKKELHDVLSFNDHEIIHLILYDLGFPPVGLSKGLVFYYRARYNNWDMDIRSKRFLLQQKIPALYKTIHPDRWRTADHTVVVPAWASFVGYLIDNYGMDTFKKLYAETSGMTEEGPVSARFKDVYGIDFQEADRSWRLYIMRYQGDAAADTLPDTAE
jgi:hypothetical protein